MESAQSAADMQFMLSSSGLAVLAPDGGIRRANPALCSLLGYSEAELCLSSWQALTPSEDQGRLPMQPAHGIYPKKIYQRLLRRGGTPLWVEISLACHAPQGIPESLLLDIKDMTEQKESYIALLHLNNELETRIQQRTAEFEESRQQLSAALAAAEAANLSKSAFLANMSHELRTPLNAVIGFSRLMANLPSLSADEVRNLEIINRAGNHLLNLINDVLELSKIEAGRVQVREEAVDLPEMIADIAEMMEERAINAGLTLTIDTGPADDLPPLIQGDRLKLKQILINLIGNAIKFTPSGGVTLRVQKTSLPGQGEVLDFSVQDSGPGIPPEEQQRIFEPFVQLGADARSSGTGLGLTICRQYLRLMGSELALDSSPGEGTVFRFRLACRAPQADLPKARAQHVHPVLAEADRGKKILIAEDTLEARLLLQCLLEPMGFTLAEAADGEAAVHVCASFQPDLILMDWRMPDVDGLEATRRIRASAGHQPRIVILSANAFEENRLAALEAGADDYLRKPLDAEALYDALEQHLQLHFVSAPGTSPAPPRAIAIGHEQLAVLNEIQREAMRKGVKELNQGKLFELFDQIAPAHPELAADCRRLVENFDFQILWRAIEGHGTGLPPEP